MSKPIERAEQFAAQTRYMLPEHVTALIEARDNAVRLALLDELEQAVIDNHAPTTGEAYSSTVGALAYKYGGKP